MNVVESKDELEELIRQIPFLLVYLSTPDCGVCKALLPKVRVMAEEFPHLDTRYVDLSLHPEIGAQYSLFTIPGILVFVNGKETIREARFVSLEDLGTRLQRIHQLAFS